MFVLVFRGVGDGTLSFAFSFQLSACCCRLPEADDWTTDMQDIMYCILDQYSAVQYTTGIMLYSTVRRFSNFWMRHRTVTSHSSLVIFLVIVIGTVCIHVPVAQTVNELTKHFTKHRRLTWQYSSITFNV